MHVRKFGTPLCFFVDINSKNFIKSEKNISIANNFFGLNVSESNSNHLDMKANHFLIIK
jgi:hypothetical protein